MIHGQPVTFGGGSGVGELSITENGTHNVKNYEFANVNINPVLLWENPSPSSVFNQQDVSIDGAGYDSFLFEVAEDRYTASYGVRKVISLIEKSDEVQILCAGTSSGRYLSSLSDSVAVFYMGLHHVDDQLDPDNNYGIPLRIWGVKISL